MSKTVCVDLNGTLDTYTGWRGPDYWYPPRPGVDRFLGELHARGYRVVVLTTRETNGVWNWLRQHGLDQHVDEVTNKKVRAVAYVDDRAITFRGDYDATLRILDSFRPYWQDDGGSSADGDQ
jgi:hypothetical protein